MLGFEPFIKGFMGGAGFCAVFPVEELSAPNLNPNDGPSVFVAGGPLLLNVKALLLAAGLATVEALFKPKDGALFSEVSAFPKVNDGLEMLPSGGLLNENPPLGCEADSDFVSEALVEPKLNAVFGGSF